MRSIFSQVRFYLYAILTTSMVTIPLYFLRGYLNTSTIALIYLLPVLLSTTSWGLGPGLVAGFAAFLTYNYFFLPPYNTLIVGHPQDILSLVVFFGVAILTSQLVGRAKQNLTAAMERERELARLYELSVALAGANGLEAIARVVLNQATDAFCATFAVIQVQAFSGGEAFEVWSEPLDLSPGRLPTVVSPLQTARGLIGEIRLWRGEVPLTPSEAKLLQTFATQGALALEREALLQAETRAKVLEESDRLKSALLSSVSHELRTPLATIKASVTSLLSGEVDWDSQSRQDLLETVDEETDDLNRLVGNLLDMSRIEAGALQPARQWNELEEIIDGALKRMRHAIEGYQIELDLPDNLPLIPVDFMEIQRVFVNLLSNSTKYASPGTMIQIKARVRDPEWVWVQVTNQGPPVASEHLDHIFEKFYRVTNADEITGTGLGLSICKGIIEAHSGCIWAENLTDRFAFSILLPRIWEGKSISMAGVEAT